METYDIAGQYIPGRVRTVELDDVRAGYGVTVLVGQEGEAFCTCRTFSFIDHGHRFRFPIGYYGSTGPHGCQHVDFVVEQFGWTEQGVTDPNRSFEASEEALVRALELGFKAGSRGYVIQRPVD